MLLGAAIQDGFIKSVEDKVTTYLPQLIDSKYQHVSIKEVLHMSSGIAWNDVPNSYSGPDYRGYLCKEIIDCTNYVTVKSPSGHD